jgi:hypothetical protein
VRAFDIPIVSLCDTPGFMVGPEAAKTAIVRHVARMFVTGASLTNRAAVRCCAAQGLRPRGAIHDRRRFSCFLLHGGMADRRVRRHGPTASGPASMPGRMSRGLMAVVAMMPFLSGVDRERLRMGSRVWLPGLLKPPLIAGGIHDARRTAPREGWDDI